MKVVIVGAGITGLSLAYQLEKRGLTDITVLEASDRVGGNLCTRRHGEFLLDLGPDAWVAQKPQTAALARELGLGEQLIAPLPGASQVHLVARGALTPLPAGMVLGVPTEWSPFLRSPLFSARAKVRVLLEPYVPRVLSSDPEQDMAVGAFAARRLGHELTDKLVAPLLGGIFAGSAWDLSLRTAFPQMIQGEAEHGSLVRAFRARRRAQGATSPFLSLRDGMCSLTDALVAKLTTTSLRTSTPVRRVAPSTNGYTVEHEGAAIEARHVVFAGPAHVPTSVLVLPSLLPRLEALQFGSAATVLLGFRAADVVLPSGSGFLVPPTERSARFGGSAREGLRLLAGTFVSSKWPGRVPRDHVLIRVFFGGPDPDALELDDATLIARALTDLRALLSITGEPVLRDVCRLRGGSPRPSPGHLERVKALRTALASHPGLHMIGNGYDGSGISDCIRQAEVAAETITASRMDP